jgi:hypothetical protein
MGNGADSKPIQATALGSGDVDGQRSGNSTSDHEIEQYIRALGTSSSRVRFVMLAVIVASIAAAATLWGERSGAWARDRLQTSAHIRETAERCKLWDNFSAALGCARDLERKELLGKQGLNITQKAAKLAILSRWKITDQKCLNVCEAANFYWNYGIRSQEGAKAFADHQWESFIENVLYVKTPILGLTFDINDLGLITGTTFAILMLVMIFYTHRAHENLFLAIWKVREVAAQEDCFDQPGGKANLLYHALAMEQVFTVPPTLARWNDLPFFRRAHYSLFFIPLIVQILVFTNDLHTATIGHAMSDQETLISLISQFALILVVTIFCLMCIAHLHADDTIWDQAFYFINPSYRLRQKSRWVHWVRLMRHVPPGWGLVGKLGEDKGKDTENKKIYSLFFTDTFSHAVLRLDWRVDGEKRGEKTLRKHEKANAHGLYRGAGESLHYYHLSGNRSRSGVEEELGNIEKLSWPREVTMSGDGKFEILEWLQDTQGNHFQISRRRIKKFDGLCKEVWEIGHSSYQVDGSKDKAGFNQINGLIILDNDLFVTDGAWVRRIDSEGTVETWGGMPLGGVVRRERPFILGIGRERKASTTGSASASSASHPVELLVCDFSLRRVLKVTKRHVKQVYQSDPGWSPAGIWVDDSFPDTFLLECREDTLLNFLRNRFSIGSYLQLCRFENGDWTKKELIWVQSRRSLNDALRNAET